MTLGAAHVGSKHNKQHSSTLPRLKTRGLRCEEASVSWLRRRRAVQHAPCPPVHEVPPCAASHPQNGLHCSSHVQILSRSVTTRRVRQRLRPRAGVVTACTPPKSRQETENRVSTRCIWQDEVQICEGTSISFPFSLPPSSARRARTEARSFPNSCPRSPAFRLVPQGVQKPSSGIQVGVEVATAKKLRGVEGASQRSDLRFCVGWLLRQRSTSTSA